MKHIRNGKNVPTDILLFAENIIVNVEDLENFLASPGDSLLIRYVISIPIPRRQSEP